MKATSGWVLQFGLNNRMNREVMHIIHDELKTNERKDFVENVSILCRLSISVRGSTSFCLKTCFIVIEETLVTITFCGLVIALRRKRNLKDL